MDLPYLVKLEQELCPYSVQEVKCIHRLLSLFADCVVLLAPSDKGVCSVKCMSPCYSAGKTVDYATRLRDSCCLKRRASLGIPMRTKWSIRTSCNLSFIMGCYGEDGADRQDMMQSGYFWLNLNYFQDAWRTEKSQDSHCIPQMATNLLRFEGSFTLHSFIRPLFNAFLRRFFHHTFTSFLQILFTETCRYIRWSLWI